MAWLQEQAETNRGGVAGVIREAVEAYRKERVVKDAVRTSLIAALDLEK